MNFTKTTILTMLVCVCSLRGQELSFHGRLVDSQTKGPLEGANLKVTSASDSTERFFGSTRRDGSFEFANLKSQRYVLRATFIGYRPLVATLLANKPSNDVGDLEMVEGEVGLGEVVVFGKQPPVVLLGDTTEFNARAFKTNPDASAEDLVTKMPTVTVENGTVKAQGEEVRQVLVDGRNFFGGDPLVALRNLPAEVIDRIQVFDKMSDQAEFTGFDDGQSVKTMNIITRPERRTGEFGKFSGGYGEQGRYSTGGNLNSFQGDRRISVLGLSNNVNQQNFSMQDLLGVVAAPPRLGGALRAAMMMRGAGGGLGGFRQGGGGGGMFAGGMGAGMFRGDVTSFLVGPQDGITTAHSLGANYSDFVTSDLDITGSYFFNITDNKNGQSTWRENILSQDSSSIYTEDSRSGSKNTNHRVNARIMYTLDPSNSFVIRPQISTQQNRSSGSLVGETFLLPSFVSQSSSNDQSSASGYSGSANIVFRHRFETPGRTLSADVGLRLNNKDNSGALQSLTAYPGGGTGLGDTTNQQSNGATDGSTISSRLSYTEPLWQDAMLEVNYSPSYTKNTNDTKAYRFEVPTGGFTKLDPRLSNVFENEYRTHNGGFGLRMRWSEFNVVAGVSIQNANLHNVSSFPFTTTFSKTFASVLPNAMIMYNPSRGTNLRMLYRSSTNAPSINQLQSVLDNSNPLFLSTGNPDLKQSTTHSIVSRFASVNIEARSTYFLFLSVSYSTDVVGNTTVSAGADSIASRGIRLNPGMQLTYPVNLDHSWNVQSLFTYGFPLDWLGSNLNLNTGVGYSWLPGLINGNATASTNTTLTEHIVLASNISPELDFTVSYAANYSIARSSLQSELNDKYFYHTAGLKFNWIVGEGIVVRNDVAHTLYDGQQPGLDQQFILWNVGLGKKFFEGDKGELQVSVRDLLNKNQSLKRSVTESSIQNTTNRVLGRYVMMTFAYTIR